MRPVKNMMRAIGMLEPAETSSGSDTDTDTVPSHTSATHSLDTQEPNQVNNTITPSCLVEAADHETQAKASELSNSDKASAPFSKQPHLRSLSLPNTSAARLPPVHSPVQSIEQMPTALPNPVSHQPHLESVTPSPTMMMVPEAAVSQSAEQDALASPSGKAETELKSEDKKKGMSKSAKAHRKQAEKAKDKKKAEKAKEKDASVATSTASDTTTPSSDASKRIFVPGSKPRFGFDDYHNALKCRKHDCGKLTNCYDGSTVICPRCGVESVLRYCSLQCLLDPDMRHHWAQECGQCPLPRDNIQVDESTLIVRPATMRPFIECAHDSPARHRQAVYHSSDMAAADYFVFNDCSLTTHGEPGQITVIGAGDVIATVSIVPDFGFYQGHSIFHEYLEDCLRIGFARPDKCLVLVDLVTKQLVASGQWNKEVQDCLVFQMKNEFNYDVPPEMLYRFTLGPAPA